MVRLATKLLTASTVLIAASSTALLAWQAMLDNVLQLKNDTETIFNNAGIALGNVNTSVVEKVDTDVNGLNTPFIDAKKNAAEANKNYDGLVNKNIAVEKAIEAENHKKTASTHKDAAKLAHTTAETELIKVTTATKSHANLMTDYQACKTAKELTITEAQLANTAALAAHTAATEAQTATNKIKLTSHPSLTAATTAVAEATAAVADAKAFALEATKFASEAETFLAAATTQYNIIKKPLTSTLTTTLTKVSSILSKTPIDPDTDLEKEIKDFEKHAKDGADTAKTEAYSAKKEADKAKTEEGNATAALTYFKAITATPKTTDIKLNIDNAKSATVNANAANNNAEKFKNNAAVAISIVVNCLNRAKDKLDKITPGYVNKLAVENLLNNARTIYLKNATESNNAAIESARLANASYVAAKNSFDEAITIATKYDAAAAKAADAFIAEAAAKSSLAIAIASHKLATSTSIDINKTITLYDKEIINNITPALIKCKDNISKITGLTKALVEKDTTQYNTDYTNLDTLEKAFHTKVSDLESKNAPIKDLYKTVNRDYIKANDDYANAKTIHSVTTLNDPNTKLTNIKHFTDSNADNYTTRIKKLVDDAKIRTTQIEKIKTDLAAAIATKKTTIVVAIPGTPPGGLTGGPPGKTPEKRR